MRVIIERIDNSFYMDVVISPQDLQRVKEGEMMHTCARDEDLYFYVGTRINETEEKDAPVCKEEWDEWCD